MRSVSVQLLTVSIACSLLACRDAATYGAPTAPPAAAAGSGAMMPTTTVNPATQPSAANANPLIVKVEDGDLEGAMNEGADVRSFLGVPYAKPPVGALRWKEPQRNTPWTGMRSAKEFGGRCAQLDSAVLMNKASDNEDCLYLNVWTPTPVGTKKLPVMFWIHGGGNVNGSTNEPVPYANSGLFYTGEFLAKKGVIVVSLNYRLGVFGFMAHSGLGSEGSKPGNQGLWDQQAALSWVQRNISNFGGDPANVTIFGESAGSFDVCMQVASPKSRGLFHKAVSESGGCTTFQQTLATAQMTGDKLAAAVGCTGAEALKCLRDKPVSQLLTALPSSGGGMGGFGPNVDGEFMPMQPRMLYDRGEIAKVPYILGSNTDEGTLFTFGTNVTNEEMYKAAITTRYPTIVDQVMEHYPVSKFMSAMNPFNAALARAFGDGSLVCSTWDTATRAAKAGSTVYMYNFDIPVSVGTNLGATHGAELVYVFGTSPALTDDEKKISELMQNFWTNFAKGGDPNGMSLLSWPKFSESMDARVNFSLMPSAVQNFRSDECKFWRQQYDARFAAEGK